MSATIALVGNPNAGKTTLFNQLTGNRQYVGNWPGVTVERKTGVLKGDADTTVVYNKKMPGLTHLLENGHVIRNKKGTYGRVAARKHIAPVAAWAEGDLVQRIERKLK